MYCGATFSYYLKCSDKLNCQNRKPIWKQYEEDSNKLIMGKKLYSNIMTCALDLIQKKKEYKRLISDGYENIVYIDCTQINKELYAVPNTASFFQVSKFPSYPTNEHQFKLSILSCFYIKYRSKSNYSFHSIR